MCPSHTVDVGFVHLLTTVLTVNCVQFERARDQEQPRGGQFSAAQMTAFQSVLKTMTYLKMAMNHRQNEHQNEYMVTALQFTSRMDHFHHMNTVEGVRAAWQRMTTEHADMMEIVLSKKHKLTYRLSAVQRQAAHRTLLFINTIGRGLAWKPDAPSLKAISASLFRISSRTQFDVPVTGVARYAQSTAFKTTRELHFSVVHSNVHLQPILRSSKACVFVSGTMPRPNACEQLGLPDAKWVDTTAYFDRRKNLHIHLINNAKLNGSYTALRNDTEFKSYAATLCKYLGLSLHLMSNVTPN